MSEQPGCFVDTPKPIDWAELDGKQVYVRVIRAEGLEQVYLMATNAIYLVSETAHQDGEE